MKQTILLFVALLLSLFTKAQDFQGMAVYETKVILGDALEKIESPEINDEMTKMIQEELNKALEKTYVLNFDKSASLYKEEEKLDIQKNSTINISINSTGGDGVRYKNIKEKKQITETTIFDKEFLVTDSLPALQWKMEGETKKIGNYTCYKATAVIKLQGVEQEENKEKVVFLGDMKPKDVIVTAWYAPEIPVSHGPDTYWGLPGLILEVNDGTMVLLCSKVVLNAKNKIEIKAPKKGKKITKKEYEILFEKKMKEQENMHEGGTVITIGG